MSRRLNVLFLPHHQKHLFKPWGEDLVNAIKDKHDIRVFDPSQPLARGSAERSASAIASLCQPDCRSSGSQIPSMWAASTA